LARESYVCGSRKAKCFRGGPLSGIQSSDHTESNQLIGVRGWLLFLCLVLTIFFPVGVLLELFAVWRRAQFPLQVLILVVTAIDIAMLALAVTAGLFLYRLRPFGVRLAQLFFVLRLVIAVVALVENRTVESGLAIAVSAAWLIYLVTSERVRRTYPSQSTRISEIFR